MASAHRGITERRDKDGRRRYLVRVRRGGRNLTATLASLEAALAWRAQAVAATEGEGELPASPRGVASVAEPPGRAVTVEDAARRLCRGMVAGSVRTNRGRLYKPSSIRKYEENLRCLVLPRIGGIPVATVRRGDVQRLVDEIAAERTAEHGRKALTALRVALRLAESYGEVDSNPCVGVRVPAAESDAEKPARIITPEEADAIVNAAYADDERLARSFAGPFYALKFASGLRMGELLALPWGAEGLDLDAGYVRVRRSVDRKRDAAGAYPFVPPKFGRYRDVPLGADDVTRLRRFRLASGRPADGELVFAQRDGSQWSHEAAHAAFVRACKAAKVAAPLPRPHDVRHAFASFALAAGVGTYAVAGLLGHADEGLVRKRYGHALPDEVAGAGAALEAFRQARRTG